jgi:hypothetical protein
MAERGYNEMPREKQHVFSARTTEEGLRVLNAKKAELGVNWDEMVVDAMCTKYGLDRNVLALPRVERPKKEPKPKAKRSRKEPKAKKTKGEKAGKVGADRVEARSLPEVEG